MFIEEKKIEEQRIVEYLEQIKPLSIEFMRDKKLKPLGFNVFKIVSDTYYREDFHSDLICNLLSPSYHKEGQLFIDEFISCLKLVKPEIIIDISDFTNPTVEREKGKIDIRIRDNISKKTIIIENKINGAIDQDNQIPRYYKGETDSNFEVVGIVYLTLTEGKTPDRTSWNTDNKTKIKIDEILIYLTASKNQNINILSHWIDKCINVSEQIDVISILRQYKVIIQHLREEEMTQELMEKFYSQVKESDNYATALSIKGMLNELNEFRAIKLKDKFQEKAKPFFQKITHFAWHKEFRAKFENAEFKNINFWIDVVCIEKETKVYFHESTTFDGKNDKIKILLEKMGEISFFKNSSKQSYYRVFKFPEQEEELFLFLDKTFTELKKLREIDF